MLVRTNEIGAPGLTQSTYNPRILAACLLAQLVLLAVVYAQTAGFDYVYVDDAQYVLANGQVRDGLSLEGLRWALGSFYMSNWHPLTWASHMFDASLFGTAPGPAHLHNAVLHGVMSLLVFLYLRRFGGEVAAALFSLLFLAHPLHVESVAWVAERKDLLSGIFFLLALMLYDRQQGRPGVAAYGAIALCYLLAVMSKAMAVTLPAALVILDLGWYRHSGQRRVQFSDILKSILEKLPLFAMAIVFSAVAIIAQREGGALVTAEATSLLERLANASYGYLMYIRQSLLPLGLAAFYPLDMEKSLASLALPLVLMLAWLVAAVRWWDTRPLLAAGLAFYLVTLLPVIGLIQVGVQLHADRYMYLPSLGVLLALQAVFPRPDSPRFRLAATLSVVFLLFCTTLAHWQTSYWENRQTLFTRVLAVAGPNWRAHAALAADYTERREFGLALQHAEAAMQLDPARVESYQLMGDITMTLGDPAAAAGYYLAGVEAAGPSANLLNNLGMAQMAQGEYAAAQQSMALALMLEPDAVRIRDNLARLEQAQRDQGQVLEQDKQ